MEGGDRESFSPEAIRDLLAEVHGIQRIEMEIAQPNRLNEVLVEMERREVIERAGPGEWHLVEG
jgi:hypothetical protein